MDKTVLIHLATGFEEIEAITMIDVLRRANLRVLTISVTGTSLVTGAHQISIKADQLFEETNYDEAAMILLPGGMPGTTNLQNHSGLRAALTLFNQQKRWIAAICAAPLILGEMGILQGKNAVCYPGFESRLSGAKVMETSHVSDGHIVTGRGPGSALDFSLALVAILKGDPLAADLRTALVMPD